MTPAEIEAPRWLADPRQPGMHVHQAGRPCPRCIAEMEYALGISDVRPSGCPGLVAPHALRGPR